MMMAGRRFSLGDYRYGFNGKENDNEVKGEGNQQDYGMRISDPRLGRFLSVDPLEDEYPELTPYQFAGNTPIQATDLDGEEPSYHYEDGKGRIVMMPAGDNLPRRIPKGHLKYLPQTSKGGPGIMDAGTSTVLDNIPVIGTGKAIIEAVFGYDATGNKLGVGESLFALVPYIGKAKKTIKVLSAVDKISDNRTVVKSLHKNNNKYVGKQSVYGIKKDGTVQKFGKADATDVSKTTGEPRRLQSQLDKLRKENPDSKIEGAVLETHDHISTKDIKKIETKYIQDHKNKTGKVPSGNKNHPGIN